MGYACPVCEDPQADAGHLANHLAFTALTRGGEHESWLDERVPEWEQLGESALAERVVELAESAEYPQVFEASGVDDHDHGGPGHGTSDAGHDHGVDVSAARTRGQGALDDEARAILAEARELTEAMRRDGDDADAPAGDADRDGDETE